MIKITQIKELFTFTEQKVGEKREILGKLVQKYEPENVEFSMQKGQFKGSENGVL